MSFYPEQTIRYKTYLKATIQNALKTVFAAHPDPILRTNEEEGKGVNVTLEFPKNKNNYPAVVVKLSEGNVKNAGVGHEELILVGDNTFPTPFAHSLYDGELQFVLYALSNYDRDLLSDAVVQTLTMPKMQGYTRNFYNALYDSSNVDALSNFINLNHDTLAPGGDQELPVPWGSEDDLLYQTTYTIKVFGEFYSPTSTEQIGGYVDEVDLYPYIEGLESRPDGADDPAPWV